MAKKIKITTIQLHEATRKKLECRKLHSRESYESVISRLIDDEIPDIEEMFKLSDSLPQEREFTTAEVIALSHRLRRQK